jgi:hypothetical protein
MAYNIHTKWGSAHETSPQCTNECVNRPPCGCAVELGDLGEPCPRCFLLWDEYRLNLAHEIRWYWVLKFFKSVCPPRKQK